MHIKDYEDYMIFKDGTVYNCKYKRFLIPHPSKNGYLRIGLTKYGERKFFSIHRLVALHFIPNPDNKPQVDHINRIRHDNRLENLRWATNIENASNKIKKPKLYFKHKNSFRIEINRNNIRYIKYCKTEEEAIIQRDLMLSMFIK